MTVVRTLGIMGVLCAIAACNEITAPDPPPFLVMLASASTAVANTGRTLPPDSCPRIATADPQWPRRALAVPGATIALTPGAARAIARFGNGRGFTASDGGAGFVAVSYDDDLAALAPSYSPPQGRAIERRAFDLSFFYRCTITVSGRPATLLVWRLGTVVEGGIERTVAILPMAVLTTAPSGRRVNIAIDYTRNVALPEYEALTARLLAMAGSLTW